MIPIVIDPKNTRMALVGRGEVALRRLALVDEGGVGRLTVFSDRPSLEFERAAGDRYRAGLPTASDLEAFSIVWIADLPLDLAVPLAKAVRGQGGLVNVEDVKAWCDFHNPAQLRRGDLLLTVSTNGRSPGLAVRIKRQLSAAFGPEWGDRLQWIGSKRHAWKQRQRPLAELARLTDTTIDAKGWLDNGTIEGKGQGA